MPLPTSPRPKGARKVIGLMLAACALYGSIKPALDTYFAGNTDVLTALNALSVACGTLKAIEDAIKNDAA